MKIENSNSEVIEMQYPIVMDFIKYYIMYEELNNKYNEGIVKNEFWVYTINGYLLQAIICWCKVFGSAENNEVHYSKLSNKDDEPIIIEDFIRRVAQGLRVRSVDFENYIKELREFRNKFVAHSVIKYKVLVPRLEWAYKTAVIYDEWIRETLKYSIFDFESIEDMALKFRSMATDSLEVLSFKTR